MFWGRLAAFVGNPIDWTCPPNGKDAQVTDAEWPACMCVDAVRLSVTRRTNSRR